MKRMRQGKRIKEQLAAGSPGQLRRVFRPWLALPEDFGNPVRRRLFSPLPDLLALPRPGPFRRPVVPGGAA
jgi:hypothetical protein